MPKFTTCFSPRPLSDPPKPGDGAGEGKKEGCVFCDVRKEKGFDVVYEDSTYIAFRDRSPQAKEHILIIPRLHTVDSVRQLKPQHLTLVTEMYTLATQLYPNHTKAGYHIPPFSSVGHLHLHVFVPPFTAVGRLKYPITGTEGRKGRGWFVTSSQVQGALERGERIRLGKA